jgi:hypothetical protein
MSAEVTIEARHLDTDARSRTVVGAVGSSRPSEQRAELVALVGRVHPRARLRSFADATATFLDSQHLIVASYSRRPPRGAAGVEGSGPLGEALSLPV